MTDDNKCGCQHCNAMRAQQQGQAAFNQLQQAAWANSQMMKNHSCSCCQELKEIKRLLKGTE